MVLNRAYIFKLIVFFVRNDNGKDLIQNSSKNIKYMEMSKRPEVNERK